MAEIDSKSSSPRTGGATFSFKHRVFRLIWLVIWAFFGRWTPVPFFAWRRFLVGLFGAKVSPVAKIYPGVSIWYPPNLQMDDFSCLGPRVNCYCMAKVTLGKFALVSQDATLCCGTHDIDDPSFQLNVRDICLERESWICAEAFVGPGVTVHEGAVLGARGVAFKNLSPWSVYLGNPTVFVRLRNKSLV